MIHGKNAPTCRCQPGTEFAGWLQDLWHSNGKILACSRQMRPHGGMLSNWEFHVGKGSVGSRGKNETWQEKPSIFILSNLINPHCVGAMRDVEEQLAIWVNFAQLQSI